MGIIVEEKDWKVVEELCPKGCIQLRSLSYEVYAPIESVVIKGQKVIFKVKWSASRKTDSQGVPLSDWVAMTGVRQLKLPIFAFSFKVEDVGLPEERVVFGANVIYVNEIEKVDKKDVKGEF